MRVVGHFVSSFILCVAISSAGPAFAGVQPMAVPAQQVSLAPRGVATRAAYCLDVKLDLPDPGASLHHVSGGQARVRVGWRWKSLQAAIDAGEIAIAGTGNFEVSFVNLTDQRLLVAIDRTTAVSDIAQSLELPAIALPKAFTEGTQRELWEALGQGVVKVSVRKRGGGFDIEAVNSDGDTVELVFSVPHDQLAKRIAQLAGKTPRLEIDAPFEPRRLYALVANVRIQTASKGVYGTSNLTNLFQLQLTEKATIGELHLAVGADAKEVSAALDLKGTSAAVPAFIVIEFKRAQSREFLDKVFGGVKGAVASVRLGFSGTVLQTAAHVGHAVKDEIRALARTNGVDEPTVLLILGNVPRGIRVSKIAQRAVSCAG